MFVVLLLCVALGSVLAPGLEPANAIGRTSPAATLPSQDDGSSITWSVRPSPTDADPERPNFGYDIAPGVTVTDSIRVRNYSEETLRLDLYASDAITTSTGALDLLPAGEEPTGVGAWISLDSSELAIAPLEFVDVDFTLTVPADAEPGDHTGGIVTSHRTPGVDDGGDTVILDRRLGNRVHVRVDGPLRPALQISDAEVSYTGSFNPVGTGSMHVTYTVTNTGNVRLGAEQTVTTNGRLFFPGRTVTPEPMGELLPGNSLTFDVDVGEVWPIGRTTATIELTPIPTRDGDVFDADTPVESASATAPTMPWALLASLAVLVGVAVLWRRQRRRRERREAALVDAAVREALADTPNASDGSDGSDGSEQDGSEHDEPQHENGDRDRAPDGTGAGVGGAHRSGERRGPPAPRGNEQ